VEADEPARKIASTAREAEIARMRVAAEKLWTDDELLALSAPDGRKRELWFGRVITMSPAGPEPGDVIMRLAGSLTAHVYTHKSGRLYDGQTGYRLSLDLCFAPDLSFVSNERLKVIRPFKEKLFRGAPDLAIEVLSPSDSITKTEEKITHYLVHGARLAWMVDLRHRSVRVYREPNKFELLRPGRFLSGNSVLPGFRCAVAKLSEDPSFV
jgi:Uma2 family endonuclease